MRSVCVCGSPLKEQLERGTLSYPASEMAFNNFGISASRPHAALLERTARRRTEYDFLGWARHRFRYMIMCVLMAASTYVDMGVSVYLRVQYNDMCVRNHIHACFALRSV